MTAEERIVEEKISKTKRKLNEFHSNFYQKKLLISSLIMYSNPDKETLILVLKK